MTAPSEKQVLRSLRSHQDDIHQDDDYIDSPHMSSLKGKLGFRVLAGPPRLPAALVDRFRGIAAPNLADAMGRFNFMDPGIQSRSKLPLCGLAVTVLCRPADNLMVHKALQVAEPGDVVVVNTCGKHDQRGVR